WALPAQQARSRATRERILEAAETAFGEHGYENARISDIAASASCSTGAIYFRFRDKDALFLAIAESFIEQTRAGLSEFILSRDAGSATTVIRTFVVDT